MSWKCENCGQKLTGKEDFCPNCHTKTIFKCMKCGKELDNGKHRYCPMCKTEKDELIKKRLKKVGAGFLAVGSFITMVFVAGGKSEEENLEGENLEEENLEEEF